MYEGIEKSDGLAFTATEDELLSSMKEMAVEEGFLLNQHVQYHSLVLRDNLETFKGKNVCIAVLTGTGLKSAHIIMRISHFRLPVLDPNLSKNKTNTYVHSGFTEI